MKSLDSGVTWTCILMISLTANGILGLDEVDLPTFHPCKMGVRVAPASQS